MKMIMKKKNTSFFDGFFPFVLSVPDAFISVFAAAMNQPMNRPTIAPTAVARDVLLT